MLYKPNYCCNCGEKIERIEWNLLTNRRFCQICETDHQFDDWIKRIFPTLFLLFGLFGIGSYFQSNGKDIDLSEKEIKNVPQKSGQVQTVKPKTLKNAKIDDLQNVGKDQESAEDRAGTLDAPAPLKQNIQPIHKEKSVVVSEKPQKKTSLLVYFCGAKTKKGSPCSRRVKGGGRCWQHEGREAILSNAELKAESN